MQVDVPAILQDPTANEGASLLTLNQERLILSMSFRREVLETSTASVTHALWSIQ